MQTFGSPTTYPKSAKIEKRCYACWWLLVSLGEHQQGQNPVTNIDFDIPVSAFVSLKIFDQLGREVTTIVSENLQAGSYRMQWDGSNFGSGTYFIKLESGSKMITKRMMLIK